MFEFEFCEVTYASLLPSLFNGLSKGGSDCKNNKYCYNFKQSACSSGKTANHLPTPGFINKETFTLLRIFQSLQHCYGRIVIQIK